MDRATRSRRLLILGACASTLGVVISSTASREVGGFVELFGWVAFGFGIHTYGRLGAM
jgi:hypothetical protein